MLMESCPILKSDCDKAVVITTMNPLFSVNDVTRTLNRRFLAALIVITLVVAANELLVQPSFLKVTRDAPVMNIAGRQRMLSQRVAKAALALEAGDEASTAWRRDELRSTLATWTAAHEQLQTDAAQSAISGDNRKAILITFAELQPHYDALRQAAESLIDNRLTRDEAIAEILTHEHQYLTLMEQIVTLYESEAHRHVRSLQWTSWGLSALVIFTVLGVGYFILLPASRMIEQQFQALQTAGERLEERVQQRTEELERTNQALRSEHQERLRAEEAKQRLQEAYYHAARVNTLGEMVSGLAHELNQPVAAIVNYIDGCLIRLDQSPDDTTGFRNALEQASRSAMRAGEIVRRVRLFAPRQVGEQVKLKVSQLIADVVSFVESNAARRGIEVQTEVASDLLFVHGDTVQLQQALINLVSNAFDAVEAASSSRRQVQLSACFVPPNLVEISVRDDGEGIASEDLDRIFVTFYSSRANGMGMGLAITRSIVEAHQGEMIVESTAGSGSLFRMRLPAVDHDRIEHSDSSHC